MQYRVLGPVEIEADDGSTIEIGSPSQRRILATLLASPGEIVSIDRLVDAVWDDPPASALAGVRSYVSRLRSRLDGQPGSAGDGYRLDPGEADVDRFEELIARADREPERAADHLGEALGLWRGPAFGEDADLECVRAEARRLDEMRRVALEARALALLEAGDAGRATAEAEALLAEDDLREGSWAVLVRGLTAQHRVGEALRSYQRAVDVLAEAGLVPSAQLRSAEAAALADAPSAAEAGDRSVATDEVEPPAPGRSPPAPTASLLGRDHDVERVGELLARSRVVTLTGPGGVGKTRLAVEVAHAPAPDGASRAVRLIELTRVQDGAAVADLAVEQIGLTAEPGRSRDALRRAGSLDLLVVVDNCEHVVDAAAELIEDLTTGGSALRVLATSRERLAVDGEHSWTVRPLSAGGADRAGVALFVERARAVAPDFEPTPSDLEAIAEIVETVDGLPLAIEMAAARVSTASASELLAKIRGRLGALSSPRRRVDGRHRTLRSVIEWSEDLLDEESREVLAGLSVFAGQFAAEDAVAVVGQSADGRRLADLADRSLVTVSRDDAGTRLGLLHIVRAHAAERLSESGGAARVRERHARHVAAVVRDCDRDLRRPEEAVAHRRLTDIFAEIRVAHAWLLHHDPDEAARLVLHLALFAESRLRFEVGGWARATAAAVTGPVARGGALGVAAALEVSGGSLAEARRMATEALALCGDDPVARHAHEAMSDACLFDGDLDASREHCSHMARLGAEVGDSHAVVVGIINDVLVQAYSGRTDEAQRALRGASPPAGLAPSDRGWLAYTEGEILLDRRPDEALAHLAAARELAEGAGNRYLDGVTRLSATSLQGRVAEPRAAVAAFASLIDHWLEQGDRTHLLTTMRNLVDLFTRIDRPGDTAELLSALQGVGGHASFGEEAERLDAAADAVAARLSADELAAAQARGRDRDLFAAARVARDRLTALLD